MPPIRWKPRRDYDDHDLSQSGLRQVAQHARHDPPERRGAGGHRISEKAADPRAAGRIDRRDGHSPARIAAREGHALREVWTWRSEVVGRSADRFRAGASNPHQPPDRHDAERRPALPPFGKSARPPTQPEYRSVREGGWRSRRQPERGARQVTPAQKRAAIV